MDVYGSLGAGWVGTGIAPPAPTQLLPTPGTPPPWPGWTTRLHRLAAEVKEAVGLISVHQLTLDAHFSDISLITEVYNLLEIHRINNHFLIPGIK